MVCSAADKLVVLDKPYGLPSHGEYFNFAILLMSLHLQVMKLVLAYCYLSDVESSVV